MAGIKIDKGKCKGCGLCIMYCPNELIVLGDEVNRHGVKPAVFKENSACTSCTFCALICPDCAIEVYK